MALSKHADQQVEIRLLLSQGKSQKDIHATLVQLHGEAALSQSSVQRWCSRIQKEGGDNLKDKFRAPKRSTRLEKLDDIRNWISADRRTSVHELAAVVKLSKSATHRAVREDLKLVKKPAKWILHLLTDTQKLKRLDACRQSLAMFRRRKNPVHTVVAQDESWIWCYEPESKQSSCQWLSPKEPRPTKCQQECSIRKCILVVFFDKDGIIHHEFIPNGRGIGKVLYQEILVRFREALWRKRPHLWHDPDGWALLQDGAPAHTANTTLHFLNYHSIQLLPHPPYSPDLNPCDYWIFNRIKLPLRGMRLPTLDDLHDSEEKTIKAIEVQEFWSAMEHLPEQMRKCVATSGDYFERD